APTADALEATVDRVTAHLRAHDGSVRLADLCHTAAKRRTMFEHRLAVAADAPDRLADALARRRASGVGANAAPVRRRIGFVCCGQGAQYAGMARGLLADEPVFARAIDEIDSAFARSADWSIRAVLEGRDPRSLADTEVAQPCLFALQVGLGRLLVSWGIAPDAIVGHSIGEIAAAHLSGALDLPAATRLVHHRGRLMQEATALGGGMAAVELTFAELDALLAAQPELSLAAENGPRASVVAGPRQAVRAVADLVAQRDRFSRMLDVEYAFHSTQMQPYGLALAQALAGLQPVDGSVAFYSTVAGGPVTGGQLNAAYWGANVRQPVRFRRAIDAMLADGIDTFIELSPRAALVRHIEETARASGSDVMASPTLARDGQDALNLRSTVARLWEAGVDVNLDRLNPTGRHTALPTYAWQRRRYWFSFAESAARKGQPAQGHPFIGRGHEVAGSGGWIWHGAVGAGTASPWLLDHQVEHTAIMPGTGYVDMALGAAREHLGDGPIELRDFTFQQPMLLPEGEAVEVQVALERDGSTSLIRVHSRTASDSWTQNTEARAMRPADAGTAPLPGRPLSAADGAPVMTGPACYAAFARAGLHYGPCFQSVERIVAANGEAVGDIRLAQPLRAHARGHVVHPALLDACLQVYVAALDSAGLNPEGATFIPLQIEQLVCHRPAPEEVSARVTVDVRAGTGAAGYSVDIDVVGVDGERVVTLRGLQIARVPEGAMARLRRRRLSEWLHTIRWRPMDLPRAQSVAPTWLLLEDESGVADGIASVIERRGARAIRCAPGPNLDLSGQRWTFDLTRPEHAGAVIAALPASPVRVVDLWPLRVRSAAVSAGDAGVDADLELACAAALHLAQALMHSQRPVDARMWLVTRGAQPVMGPVTTPLAATAWGFGRVASIEMPELWGGLIDLDPRVEPDPARIVDAIEAGDGEDQIGLSGDARHVARLAPHREVIDPIRIQADATYLVTGGLGGLGRLTAEWLLDRGARHVILLARSTPTEEMSEAIKQWSARFDAEIVAVRCDVANPACLRNEWSALRGRMPAIRGVFHCAGTAADEGIATMRWSTFRETARPKVDGMRALLDGLACTSIDFVVAYSSVAGLLGSHGKANYAAANAFLDSVAAAGNAARVVSVGWGLWDGIGMATSLSEKARDAWRGEGHALIDAARGREILDRTLSSPSGLLGAFSVDWSRQTMARRLASDVSTASAEARETGAEQPLGERLAACQPSEVAATVDQGVRRLVAAIVGLSVEGLDIDHPLARLGFDSLMGMQLRGAIERETGVRMPLTRILRDGTTRWLVDTLIDRLEVVEAPAIIETELPAIDLDDAVHLLAQIDTLNEDQINEMLARMGQGELR
ncbi:MAG: SDR family NAD(P)-dependent oxidoreductase, partial [Myxococcales bacterium]|nr:SDR family NAD(P)-dependent oxidoreductase [Myxococcales bacterium]